MRSQNVATVDTWHRLLNDGDIERLVALIHRDIELGGPRSVSSNPRGMSSGIQVFREWFGRAGIQLTPLRYFHKGNVVVAEEEGVWHSPDDGHETGRQVVWSLFTLEDGLITGIKRFDTLPAALREAGLNESTEVPALCAHDRRCDRNGSQTA